MIAELSHSAYTVLIVAAVTIAYLMNFRFDSWFHVDHNDIEDTDPDLYYKPLKVKATIKDIHTAEVDPVSGRYVIELCDLSDKALQALSERGIKLKHEEECGLYVRAVQCMPFRAHEIPTCKNITGLHIEKGTECLVSLHVFEWKFKEKKGYAIKINRLDIKRT